MADGADLSGEGASRNLLSEAAPSLAASHYFDAAHYQRELAGIWAREWLYVCRSSQLPETGCFQTVEIGDQKLLVVRDKGGGLNAFHNTCRHRGAILCPEPHGKLRSKAIVCPYHRWSYTLKGELRGVPSVQRYRGFTYADYPLYGIAVTEWRGMVFLNLAGKDAPPFDLTFGADAALLDNWPLEDLVIGHSVVKTLACNWKIFWENFNECLHCPGIHPSLSRLVPIYKRGLMTERDDPDWASYRDSNDAAFRGGLGAGRQSWSMDGTAHAGGFPALTADERREGAIFAVGLPSIFIVAHVDYVRTVRVRPLGPEATELSVDWLFAAETLADPTFRLANITDFVEQVLAEDAHACELNQAGLKAAPHEAGVLMAEEYELHRFHNWVRDRL